MGNLMLAISIELFFQLSIFCDMILQMNFKKSNEKRKNFLPTIWFLIFEKYMEIVN